MYYLPFPQICTRLPGPDVDFQSGQPVRGPFLSEAITESTPKFASLFNECIILATLCGRSLLRFQQYSISSVYGDGGNSDWLTWHRWLDDTLTTRLQVMTRLRASSPNPAYDPLLLFSNVLGHTAVVYHCKGAMESWASLTDRPEVYAEVMQCQARALAAATAIVRLAGTLREFHFSKVSDIRSSKRSHTHDGLTNLLGKDLPTNAYTIICHRRVPVRQSRR